MVNYNILFDEYWLVHVSFLFSRTPLELMHWCLATWISIYTHKNVWKHFSIAHLAVIRGWAGASVLHTCSHDLILSANCVLSWTYLGICRPLQANACPLYLWKLIIYSCNLLYMANIKPSIDRERESIRFEKWLEVDLWTTKFKLYFKKKKLWKNTVKQWHIF